MSQFFNVFESRSDLPWCYFLRGLGRDGHAMERVLHDLGVMDQSGWMPSPPSNLTATGAPALVRFQAGRGPIYITTDLPDADVPPTDRLAQACKAMARFGGAAPDPALCQRLQDAQSTARLSFGARLDLTISARRPALRIWAELPAQAHGLTDIVMPEAKAGLQAISGDMSLTMLGFGGIRQDITVYGRIAGATCRDLLMLTQIANVAVDPLVGAIDGLAGNARVDGLAPTPLGFSLTKRFTAMTPTLTVFLDAQKLIGDHDHIHRRIMACGGRQMNGYADLMDHYDDLPTTPTPFGLIGLTTQSKAAPRLSVDVAAPWAPQLAQMHSAANTTSACTLRRYNDMASIDCPEGGANK